MIIDVNSTQGRCLIVAAARYSFRRQTYMPSVIAEVVERNIEAIDPGTCAILARDIRSEKEMDERIAEPWYRVDRCWEAMLPMLDKRAEEEI